MVLGITGTGVEGSRCRRDSRQLKAAAEAVALHHRIALLIVAGVAASFVVLATQSVWVGSTLPENEGKNLLDATDTHCVGLGDRLCSLAMGGRQLVRPMTRLTEATTALGEVNTTVRQLDHVTQQNAAMVEEGTAASHTLALEAAVLASLTARFQIAG